MIKSVPEIPPSIQRSKPTFVLESNTKGGVELPVAPEPPGLRFFDRPSSSPVLAGDPSAHSS